MSDDVKFTEIVRHMAAEREAVQRARAAKALRNYERGMLTVAELALRLTEITATG